MTSPADPTELAGTATGEHRGGDSPRAASPGGRGCFVCLGQSLA